MAKKSIQRQAATIQRRTTDSFVNFASRLGFGAGSQQDGSRFRMDFISRNPYNLEAAYRSNWLCGKVIDAYAQDMTRAGIELHSDEMKPDAKEKVNKAFERLKVWSSLTEGVQWSRLYGGCVVVLLVDGQRLDSPLNLETVGKGQFKGLLALDRWQVNPSLENLVTEFGPNLGKPMYYRVNAAAKALIGENIHYSRVIRIDGIELPWRQQISENGWGQSVLERLWDRVVAFDSTSQGAAQLVYKAHLRTLKIKGLREIIAMGGKALQGLIEQMNMIRQYQTNEGMTLLDDTDTFETHSYTFAGLDDLLLQFGQQLSGATGIPLVRLFGQSPAGLNSSGESDLRTYYDNIAQEQDQKLRPGVGVVLELIHRSELDGQPLPDGFGFEFNPLWQMSEEQKAEVLAKKTTAIVEAYNSAIISWPTALKELRNAARVTGVFTNISDEEIEDAENAPPPVGELDDIDPATGEPKLKEKENDDKRND
jgi:phage-related protein (TIGR01555 family)